MEFQTEFIEWLIEKREQELAQEGIGQSIVDRLTMEINYLKALLVRYEIAKILQLDKDPSFMDKDYFGVEEISLGNLNLSGDDIKKIFELRAQLPKEQFDIYKKRVRLAEIIYSNAEISIDSLDNIELAVHMLDQFHLSEEAKTEFLLIADEIKSLGQSTTKIVPYREEAFSTLQEAVSSLNVENIDDYINLKESNFKKIEQVISFISGEKLNSLFMGIHNYQFALDLMGKYPNIKATVDMGTVEKLLNILESSTLEEEQYSQYLDLLCSSLEQLYTIEENKQVIEDLLNQIDSSKYKLRLGLDTKLHGIQNVDFSIKDNEIEALFSFIDHNYDSLDEATREAYYHLIEEKLKDASKNIQTIDLVNQFTMKVTNKALEDRLRKIFSKTSNIKFANQHDDIFQSIVKDHIDALQKEKATLEKKKQKGFLFDARFDARIREIDKEIVELQKMNSDTDNRKIQDLDKSFNENIDKIIKMEKDLDRLKQLRESVKLRVFKNVVDKKIEKREKKLKKLESKRVKIVGEQTKKLIPEVKLRLSENKKIRFHEARGEVFQTYADDYAKAAETERNLHGMFSGIKAAFYDFKANSYQRKADFNVSMCERLRDRKIALKGANERRISSSTYEMAVQTNQQQVAVQTTI